MIGFQLMVRQLACRRTTRRGAAAHLRVRFFDMTAILIFVLLCVSPVGAEILVVEGIEFSARDASSLEAKRKVFNRARREAVRLALLELGQPSVAPNDFALESAIAYIEVIDERVAPTYYKAQFRFGLYDDVLLDQFRDTGASSPLRHSAPGPNWIFVVPVRFKDEDFALWSRDDPWIAHWIYPSPKSSIPLLTSLPDDEDRELMSRAQAVRRDEAALMALAQKYGAPAAAYVTLNTPANPEIDVTELEVDYWSPETGMQRTVQAVAWREDHKESLVAVANLAESTIISLSGVANGVGTGSGLSVVPIVVDIETQADWLNVSRELRKIRGLRIDSVRFSLGTALANLIYSGPRHELVNKLRSHGLLDK